MRFAGIDLAWSPRNPSGAVILSLDGEVLARADTLGSDDQILGFVTSHLPPDQDGLVAVDAPLSVPNETGSRPCDRQVASIFGRFQAGAYPTNRRTLARYGGFRAERIRERLEALGFRHGPSSRAQVRDRRVIEVFPHPATVSLFQLKLSLKYKARRSRSYETRWHELGRLRDALVALAQAAPPLRLPDDLASLELEGVRGKALKAIEDTLDAVVCAYSAYYAWLHGPRGYALYGPQLHDGCLPAPAAKDMGHILVPMTLGMWERIKTGRILFLDRDGTLNSSPNNRPPNHVDEVRLLPGVESALHRYASQGWRLVIVTNQGGVAFGYQTEGQAHAVHDRLLELLPVDVDASYLCPHHPDGTLAPYAIACPNRKPAPGAILDALTRFQADPRACLFVGDQPSDRQAAADAGVDYCWARDFFGW